MKTTQTIRLTQKLPRISGFTLIELLICITIVIVLAAVVFAMTGKIRSKAQQANAMSTLRQVAGFGVAYSTENNGDINTMRWKEDKQTEGRGGKYVTDSYWGRLQPYFCPDIGDDNQKKLGAALKLRIGELFTTPDTKTMAGTLFSGARVYHDGSGLPVPVAFNNNLHTWGKYQKVSSFGDPSQVLYATYGFGHFNETHGQAYAKMPRDNSVPTNKIYYLDNKQALVAFLDGHMDMISAPIPDRNYK